MSAVLRLRRPATVLAILVLAAAGAGCGSTGDPGGGSDEARTLLENAFEKGSADSGDLELEVKADVEGIGFLEDPLRLHLRGPFKKSGERKLPSLDWDVAFDGASLKLSGGVIATGSNAYLQFHGRSYELGEDVFARFARRLALKEPDRPLSPGQLGMDPASWLEDPKVEDGEEIGGDDTRKVTGSVNVRKVVKDMVDVIESPAVRKRLERAGGAARDGPKPTEKDLEEIEGAIEDADVELNVDQNDVLRRFFAEIDLNLKDDGEGEDVKGKVSFAYVLREVGTNPVIRPPADARPLRELTGGLDLEGLRPGFYHKRD